MPEPRCPHPDDLLCWSLDDRHEAACNEDGWVCGGCHERLGFRPDLDRSLLSVKVFSLLHELHNHGLVYVSNGEMGDRIGRAVVRRLRDSGVYDQLSILQLLLIDPNLAGEGGTGHAEFWSAEADAWLAAGREGA